MDKNTNNSKVITKTKDRLIIDAKTKSINDLKAIIRAANGVDVIIENGSSKSALDLEAIVKAGNGNVIFAI